MSKKSKGWDALASWYDGWMGANGSDHHRRLAIPAALDLLNLQADEQLLDIGAGQGVLAPYAKEIGVLYTGIEISPRLLKLAKNRHPGRFIQGDARRLPTLPSLKPSEFDAAVFLLSIQDMNPLHKVLHSAAWTLRDYGRLVILMTHPCFRIPRQSGWGKDPQRQLQFRRVDHYLTPLEIPMKQYGKSDSGVSISFHRPLHEYVNSLATCGLYIDELREITTFNMGKDKAEHRANQEIPLFMGIRALKLPRQ